MNKKELLAKFISTQGYKRNSPDVHRPVNVIPSNKITMEDVDFNVLGIDDQGNHQVMIPGEEYEFPGNYVTEFPIKKQGGNHGGLDRWFAEKWVDIKTGKECGRDKGEKRKGYPACRPSKRISEDTPKTASELSTMEKDKFKRTKTSSKRIPYQHERKQDGGTSEKPNMTMNAEGVDINSQTRKRLDRVMPWEAPLKPGAWGALDMRGMRAVTPDEQAAMTFATNKAEKEKFGRFYMDGQTYRLNNSDQLEKERLMGSDTVMGQMARSWKNVSQNSPIMKAYEEGTGDAVKLLGFGVGAPLALPLAVSAAAPAAAAFAAAPSLGAAANLGFTGFELYNAGKYGAKAINDLAEGDLTNAGLNALSGVGYGAGAANAKILTQAAINGLTEGTKGYLETGSVGKGVSRGLTSGASNMILGNLGHKYHINHSVNEAGSKYPTNYLSAQAHGDSTPAPGRLTNTDQLESNIDSNTPYMAALPANMKKEGGNVPTNPELWSRAKAAAKAKYDVYPSAYANGFAAKWYKERGGGWKKMWEGGVNMEEMVQTNIPNRLPFVMADGGNVYPFGFMEDGGNYDMMDAEAPEAAAVSEEDLASLLQQGADPNELLQEMVGQGYASDDAESMISNAMDLLGEDDVQEEDQDAEDEEAFYDDQAQEDESLEEMKAGGIPQRYKNMGFNKVGVKKQSNRPGKKWMVLAKKGDKYKVVHGGYKGMQDYTQHNNEKRRKNFWNRMGGKNSAKATDPFSPLYWHKRFGTWESGGELPEFQLAGATYPPIPPMASKTPTNGPRPVPVPPALPNLKKVKRQAAWEAFGNNVEDRLEDIGQGAKAVGQFVGNNARKFWDRLDLDNERTSGDQKLVNINALADPRFMAPMLPNRGLFGLVKGLAGAAAGISGAVMGYKGTGQEFRDAFKERQQQQQSPYAARVAPAVQAMRTAPVEYQMPVQQEQQMERQVKQPFMPAPGMNFSPVPNEGAYGRYGGMYQIGGETQPLSYDEWLAQTGRGAMGMELQDQQDYKLYTDTFVAPSATTVASPMAPKTKQKSPGLYTMDPGYGTYAANNALIGFGMVNDVLADKQARQNREQYNQRLRTIGNSDNRFMVSNPVNPFGNYTLNAGPASNFGLVANTPAQDFGTSSIAARYGGSKNYREGGEYMVTEAELRQIMESGGIVEFLD